MSKQRNFLDLQPIVLHKNYKVEDDIVFLQFHHDKLVQKFLRWLVKKDRTSVLELDNLGSQCFLAINGERTIFEIINLLLESENDTYESMQERVFMFIKLLLKKKIIKLS